MRCMSRSAVSCCIQTPALLGDKLWILRRQLLVITSEKIWFCAASSILHDFERNWGKQRSTTNLVEPYFSKGNPNIKLVGYISCIISVHIPWKSWNIYSIPLVTLPLLLGFHPTQRRVNPINPGFNHHHIHCSLTKYSHFWWWTIPIFDENHQKSAPK